jgi:hypothetical protein
MTQITAEVMLNHLGAAVVLLRYQERLLIVPLQVFQRYNTFEVCGQQLQVLDIDVDLTNETIDVNNFLLAVNDTFYIIDQPLNRLVWAVLWYLSDGRSDGQSHGIDASFLSHCILFDDIDGLNFIIQHWQASAQFDAWGGLENLITLVAEDSDSLPVTNCYQLRLDAICWYIHTMHLTFNLTENDWRSLRVAINDGDGSTEFNERIVEAMDLCRCPTG